MDKKNIAAIAIVGVIVVGLLIFLFVGDVTSDTVLTVGKTDYSVDDFISYVRTWEQDGTYADFDTYVENHKSELDEDFKESDYLSTIFQTYEVYKMYAQEADSLGVVLSEDEIPTIESGDEAELLNDYGLTSGEYIRVQTEIAKANKFFTTPGDYISGDENITKSYISYNNYDPNKIYNTFKYRVVQVPIEQVEEPEEELDISGENAVDVSGEKAKRVEEAKNKTEAILDLVKAASGDLSGDIGFNEFKEFVVAQNNDILNEIFAGVFESGDDDLPYDVYGYIAKAIPNQRYSANLVSVENGALDSVSAMFMNEDLNGNGSYLPLFVGTLYSSNVVPFLSKASEGEYSEVFVTDDSASAGFIVLEDIEGKLSDEDQKRFDANVLNYYIQSMVEITPKNKARVTSIKLADIIPTIARQQEEKKQAELAASGDVVEAIDPSEGIEEIPEEDVVVEEVSGE